jgi:hypothetical protein
MLTKLELWHSLSQVFPGLIKHEGSEQKNGGTPQGPLRSLDDQTDRSGRAIGKQSALARIEIARKAKRPAAACFRND